MAPTIASRVERRWRSSPGVVKAFIEQRDVRAVDNAAAARAPVGASAFEGNVVGTRRGLDDEDVEILAREATEVVPDISALVNVTTVVKVKECVRRWRARVRSSLPTPERKTVTRMARTREDDATVTLCEETVARAMKDPAAVRCPHLLAADDDTGGFWRSDDDGARFVKPRSVRTVRVNAPSALPRQARPVRQVPRGDAGAGGAKRRGVSRVRRVGPAPRHEVRTTGRRPVGKLTQLCLLLRQAQPAVAEAEERFRPGLIARPRRVKGVHRTVVRVPAPWTTSRSSRRSCTGTSRKSVGSIPCKLAVSVRKGSALSWASTPCVNHQAGRRRERFPGD